MWCGNFFRGVIHPRKASRLVRACLYFVYELLTLAHLSEYHKSASDDESQPRYERCPESNFNAECTYVHGRYARERGDCTD